MSAAPPLNAHWAESSAVSDWLWRIPNFQEVSVTKRIAAGSENETCGNASSR
jgi:hypothetical protein